MSEEKENCAEVLKSFAKCVESAEQLHSALVQQNTLLRKLIAKAEGMTNGGGKENE